eukprot:2410358-Pleurochrysis_carterae.AAC.1
MDYARADMKRLVRTRHNHSAPTPAALNASPHFRRASPGQTRLRAHCSRACASKAMDSLLRRACRTMVLRVGTRA